jgi:heat shock protein HtpX
VPGPSEPLLTYNRIDANRRRTRTLLGAFALVILPVVSGASVYVMPWVLALGFMIAYQVYGAEALQAMLAAMQSEAEARRGPDGRLDISQLPASALMLEGGALAVALVVVVVVLVAATVFLISRFGSRALLRVARAQRVDAAREPELFRVVENLCIGAGLPVPGIHMVEAATPNAFAIGRDPEHAALIVTRGLLTLLDRRELEGVIAHELSHIGNHDIRLSTTLAALVGTLSIPFRIVAAPVRFVFRLPWGYRLFALFVGWQFGWMMLWTYWEGLNALSDGEFLEGMPAFLWWWGLHAMLAPLYTLLVAPVLSLLIRQAVSRQREFLADADAVLLTRDPEALALALVKVASTQGDGLRVGEGSVHLYFTDPMARGRSVLHWMFPSHPPVEERIELLARMGSGITPGDLQRARQAGADAAAARLEIERRQEQAEQLRTAADSSADSPGAGVELEPEHEAEAVGVPVKKAAAGIPLYEQPDGWSRVLMRLAPDAALRATGRHGEFIRVVTGDNVSGYVSANAGVRLVAAPEKKGIA